MELAFAGLHQLCAPMLDRPERLPGPHCDALGLVFGLSCGEARDRFVVAVSGVTLRAGGGSTSNWPSPAGGSRRDITRQSPMEEPTLTSLLLLEHPAVPAPMSGASERSFSRHNVSRAPKYEPVVGH